MRNLLGRLAGRHAIFLAFSIVLLAGFEYLICVIVSTVNVSGAIEELMKFIPPFLSSLVSEQLFAGLTSRGILAFGWNHPIPQALGAAVAIVLATRAVAGEVESGVMELLLSQPFSRMSYMAAQTSFGFMSLALLSLAGVAGTTIGQEYFELGLFNSAALLKLALNYFLLQSTWFAITLVFSVFGRESGRVASAAFLLALISYFVNVIGTLWSDATFLLPYSLHAYYSPQAILVQGTLAAKSVLVLSGVLIACIGFAAWRFQRRDIP